ncbi:MAG: metal ABC transporter substrate-binding protein [Acidimicrobiales bacterium]
MRSKWTAAAMATLVLTSACGTSATAPLAGSRGDRVTVVASFYPLAVAAERVGGDGVVVANLTPPGAEPHDLELSPPEVEQLQDADVVLVMGRKFQPAVEEVAASRTNGTVALLATLPVPQEGEVDDQREGGFDPHVWLDPALMADIVEDVAAALSQADPERAGMFRANADTFRRELEGLDGRYATALAGCEQRTMVTSHAAFAYLADRYGMTQQAVAGLSPEAEPDPRRLAALSDLVAKDGITTIFTENLVSPKVAQTLAKETGVTTAVLNPLEGLTDDQRAEGADYVSVMDDNLAVLSTALDCR